MYCCVVPSLRRSLTYLEREKVGTVRRQHARLPQQLHGRREHLPVAGPARCGESFFGRSRSRPRPRPIPGRRRRRRHGFRRFRGRRRTRRGLRKGQQERQPSLLRPRASARTKKKKPPTTPLPFHFSFGVAKRHHTISFDQDHAWTRQKRAHIKRLVQLFTYLI